MPEKNDLREHPSLRDVVEGTGLNRKVHSSDEAVVLTLLYTRKMMDVLSQRFFTGRDVTEAEFAALMTLYDYRNKPLKQAEIASMLLVTRLSARDVLLRLERKKLIEPAPHADKRARALCITELGKQTLRSVRSAYYRMIGQGLAGLSDRQKATLLDAHSALRQSLQDGLSGHALDSTQT